LSDPSTELERLIAEMEDPFACDNFAAHGEHCVCLLRRTGERYAAALRVAVDRLTFLAEDPALSADVNAQQAEYGLSAILAALRGEG
jgi:hypothetical protein